METHSFDSGGRVHTFTRDSGPFVDSRIHISYSGDDPRITNVMDALTLAYTNGGVLFGMFQFHSNAPDEQLRTQNETEGPTLVREFLRSTAVANAFPGLGIIDEEMNRLRITRISLSEFVAELASCMFYGGAYPTNGKVVSQARRDANDFCEAIFGKRTDSFLCYRTYDRWANWFWGIAWDKTWVILDEAKAAILFLAVTDVD